jgi:hypothetical protein
MVTNRLIACCILLSLSVLSCSKDSSTDGGGQGKTITDFVVKNGEIAGWSYAGTAWTASNLSELTIYIDGMAEVYRRHGFVEAVHQEYQGTVDNLQAQIKLTVYNQNTGSNAVALYSDTDLGFSSAIDWTNGAGEKAHYVRNGGLSQVMAFYRGGHFVYFEINTDTDRSLEILKTFALNVDGKLKNG